MGNQAGVEMVQRGESGGGPDLSETRDHHYVLGSGHVINRPASIDPEVII